MTPPGMTPEEQREIRARQRARAIVTGVILAGLVVLFYAITMVKMGVR